VEKSTVLRKALICRHIYFKPATLAALTMRPGDTIFRAIAKRGKS
jgi:hypothetical protein